MGMGPEAAPRRANVCVTNAREAKMWTMEGI